MRKTAAEISYFLFSQAFADGLRMTFAVLLPALLGFQNGWFAEGLALSLGALCVSLADAPGPLLNKRNGMLACMVFIFFVSLITAFTRTNAILLGIEICVFAFYFSMFNAYGSRAAGVGTAAILVMILTMDDPAASKGPLANSALIAGGGAWYFLISIIFSRLQPYRPAQRILGECIREIARFLDVKAAFYDPEQELAGSYQKLVSEQIKVNEKLDAVREILFKTRMIVNESTVNGRKLVFTFVETVDLFEEITASYYNYEQLRSKFGSSGVLEEFSAWIKRAARELDEMGIAIQINSKYHSYRNLENDLTEIKNHIDALPKNENESQLVLKKILVNLRRLMNKMNEVSNYFSGDAFREKNERFDHAKFISHQPLDAKVFLSNLGMSSSVFRHSLRVAIACLAGYVITKGISYGEYSYWVLLTIAFILKPAFSLTRERNIQRIIGTVTGGAAGIGLLLITQNRDLLFVLMVLFMLLDYSLMRVNYLATVFFTTLFVLIFFYFLGVGISSLAQERIFDTLLGCGIAFAAGTFLFPSWEKDYIRSYVNAMLKANAAYLNLIAKGLGGQKPDMLNYKLVRKEVYIATANLSAAFQRMLSEPKDKQENGKKMQEFIVLNHILFSNIATVATGIMRKESRKHPQLLIQTTKNSIAVLKKHLDEGEPVKPVLDEKNREVDFVTADDVLLKDQIDFIYGLSKDISKNISAMNL
jgi:uncharacterized membrane protein (TIGR01666 family)